MSSLGLTARAACWLFAAGVLTGCGTAAPRSRAQAAAAAARSACRARADEVFLRQNRGDVYRADTFVSDTRDSPFSTSGLPGITSNGLSGQYQRDNMVSSCVYGGGGPSGPAATLSVSPPGSQ